MTLFFFNVIIVNNIKKGLLLYVVIKMITMFKLFRIYPFFILLILLTGCNKVDSYKIDTDIKDVYNLKINKNEYLKDILNYNEKEEDDAVYFDLEDSSTYNDYDLSNVSVTMLQTNENKLLKDIIKKDQPTLILRLSAYCEYCKELQSKNIFDDFKKDNLNILFWCEDIGTEDQLKYLENLGIDKKYAIQLNLPDEYYNLNDIGFPTCIFLNYENKIKIVFQAIKPTPTFAKNLLYKLTKENY